MLSQYLLVSLLSLLATAAAAASIVPTPVVQASKSLAPIINNNPRDALLRADFPSGGSQTVTGVIQFYSINGTAKVHVDVTGLPKNVGLFSYHIHDKPVGENKTCETGAHFNPYGATGTCDNQPNDSYCAVGDLSGKNGLINTTCFELFYYDQYLSLNPSSGFYIGGKSISIHLIDTNQVIACGTIKPSREPEDLLLLKAETEAEEVRKYEELAGIVHSEPAVLSVAAISEQDLLDNEAPTSSDEVVEVVEEEDDEGEDDAETETETEAEESEKETEPEDLEAEDFEKLRKDSVIGNSSNVSFVGNTSNLSNVDDDNDHDHDESKASGLSGSIAYAGLVACVLSFFF